MIKSSTRSITKQILNDDTGELESVRFIEDSNFKKGFKKGWRMVYKDYDEMLIKVIRSSKDMYLFSKVKDMINRDFELNLNIQKESVKLGVQRDKLSKFLSRLVDAGFLRRTDIGFISNPYMYIPYMATDIADKQQEWEKI